MVSDTIRTYAFDYNDTEPRCPNQIKRGQVPKSCGIYSPEVVHQHNDLDGQCHEYYKD